MDRRFVGLWSRSTLESPPGTPVDSTSLGSAVFWLQSPSGSFADVRSCKSESFRRRAFAGVAKAEKKIKEDEGGGQGWTSTTPTTTTATTTNDVVTWERHIDTAPEFLPTGVDLAPCVLSPDGLTLVEEVPGDYKEVWLKVGVWDDDKFGDGSAGQTRDRVMLENEQVRITVERRDVASIFVEFVDKVEAGNCFSYNTAPAPTPSWLSSAVLYQVYPRSFLSVSSSSEAGGVGGLVVAPSSSTGTLRGITSKLPYLSSLGVTCLWLSPIQPSPNLDYGYDQSDYVGVDPSYGDLSDVKDLVDGCHKLGMKVLLDGVFNHTSDQHAWFKESRSSRDNPKRDWYIWRDEVPNNWHANFGGRAWTKCSVTNSYYLHSFLPEQPDLNWRNPSVVEAVLSSTSFWYDLGIDGFRLDVFNCYYKHPTLLSNPRRLDPLGLLATFLFPFVSQHHVNDRDQPELIPALRRLRAQADERGKLLIGETLDERFEYGRAKEYAGDGRLHLAFNFKLLHSSWGAAPFHRAIVDWSRDVAWPTWVVSNHDMPRHASRWGLRWDEGGTDARMKLVAAMLLTLRGTPVLYYGEEIGMRHGRLKYSELKDVVGLKYYPFHDGRDGDRTPMQWRGGGGNAGFCEEGVEPWLPVQGDAGVRKFEAQEKDEESILECYKALGRIRREREELQTGGIEFEEPRRDVMQYERGGRLVVMLNFAGGERAIDSSVASLKLLFSTYGKNTKAGTLKPYEAAIFSREDTANSNAL